MKFITLAKEAGVLGGKLLGAGGGGFILFCKTGISIKSERKN